VTVNDVHPGEGGPAADIEFRFHGVPSCALLEDMDRTVEDITEAAEIVRRERINARGIGLRCIPPAVEAFIQGQEYAFSPRLAA
jgi:hypothetical protein